MARFKAIDPSTATGHVKELFDGPLKGKHFNIFKTMAGAPATLDAYLGLAGALNKTSLSMKEREAIQLALARANACAYCEAAHTAIGKMAGLTAEQTVEARIGKMSDKKMDALVKFVLAMNEKRGHVSEADIAAARAAGYGDQQIMESVAAAALALYTNWFNHVADPAIDFPAVAAV